MDLRALLAVAGARDLDIVRTSIALIRSRGYERDKDLELELKRALAESRT